MAWVEVHLTKLSREMNPSAGSCPKCGGELHLNIISCPEGKLGCLVAHYGYVCDDCHRVFKQGDTSSVVKERKDGDGR
jgi:uncharacterized protein with PIN domain